MKRVAEIAAAAVVVAIFLWVACETMGVDVRADRLFVFFVSVLAALLAIDFVDRRITGAERVSAGAAGVAAGVHAAGVTFIAWTAAEMAGLEEVQIGVYVCMFAATLVVRWLVLR